MAKRRATKKLKSLEEATASLRALAEAEIQLEIRRADCDTQVNEIKEIAAAGAQPHLDASEGLIAQLEEFYRDGRDEFEADGRRSLTLTYGRIGIRLGTPELKTVGGKAWKAVVGAVRRALGEGYVRSTDSVDKDAVHAAGFDAAALKRAGLRIAQTERFFYEIDRTTLGME